MPSPPHEFPIPEELYRDYVVTDSFEDLWPLLDETDLPTQGPPEAHDVGGTMFSSIDVQVVSENVDPWFLQQQECGVSVNPLLLEYDNLAGVTQTYDHHQVNPDSFILQTSEPTLLAAQEKAGSPPRSSRAEKGKRKLKSLRIPDNYGIHQLDNELPGTEGFDQGRSVVAKKQNHNAKERVRRLELNASYLALGALLPDQSRKSKKRWTAPSIIDKMIHYIPELKTEIEELNNKKEELDAVSKISIQDNTDQDIELGSTTVSVHEVNGREELIVQVCMKIKEGIKDEEDNTFSYLLWNLEVEDFLLLGASTNNVGKDRVCYSLHVQMRGSCSSHGFNYSEALKEKVLSWLRSYTTH